jgi:hypothetical protein
LRAFSSCREYGPKLAPCLERDDFCGISIVLRVFIEGVILSENQYPLSADLLWLFTGPGGMDFGKSRWMKR